MSPSRIAATRGAGSRATASDRSASDRRRQARPWIRPPLPIALLSIALLGAIWAGSLQADPRTTFLEAEQALARGDAATFERLSESLRDYVLYPYLRFAALSRNLAAASDRQIETFLAEFPDTQLASRLRPVYLTRLAAAERWAEYARVYRPDDAVERRCYYLRSLLETGRRDEVYAQVEPLWLSPRSQPAACDPVFAAWRDAGRLTTRQILARLRAAIEAGETALARYLAGLVPAAELDRAERWLQVEREPARVLDPAFVMTDDPQGTALLAHGLVGLARRSPGLAADALLASRARLSADPAASDRAHAAVGRAALRAGDPRGLAIWDGLHETTSNLAEQEERLRAAIARRAWDRVADWVSRMPDGDEKRDRWLYWQGRAEESLGRAAAARRTWSAAAESRSLWGFLAADRLALPYRLEPTATPAEPARIRALVASPTLARMRELSRLGRDTDLRREWRELLPELEGPDLLAAAYVADVMRWHDLAVPALARADYWDDLELRFPLRYRDLVAEQAWQQAVDAEWILAVIRQESVFARALASHADAIGLMQLLPGTAREVARALGVEPPSRGALLDPAINIKLGSGYLRQMHERFGHLAVATAAYNAGPARVIRWLPPDCLEADLWILSIPFGETRRYVERVLAYGVIYGARLRLPRSRLSDRLPPVPGADFFES